MQMDFHKALRLLLHARRTIRRVYRTASVAQWKAYRLNASLRRHAMTTDDAYIRRELNRANNEGQRHE